VNPRRLLLYADMSDPDGKRLLAAIAGAIPKESLKTFQELQELSLGLRAPGRENMIAVLFAAESEELQKIFQMRDLLADVPVILVIPNQNEATIHLAHQMAPRFMSQKGSDFSGLAKVLKKMLQSSA